MPDENTQKSILRGKSRSELIGLIGKYEADALAWRAYRRTSHCPCCGNYVGNCMCFGGAWAGQDGKQVSNHCTPQDHGREGYGWDDL